MTDNLSPLKPPGYSLVLSELEKLVISEIQLGSNKDKYNARHNPMFRDDLVCNTLLPKLSEEFNNNATGLRKALVEVVLDSDIKFYDESSKLVVANREFIVRRYVKNLFNQQVRTYNKNIANGEDQVPEEEVPEVPRQNNHPEPQPQPVYPSYPSSSAHPGPAPQYHRRQGFYRHQQFPYQSQQVDSYYDSMDLYNHTQNLLHSSVSMPVFHPMQQQMYSPQQHMYPPHQGNSICTLLTEVRVGIKRKKLQWVVIILIKVLVNVFPTWNLRYYMPMIWKHWVVNYLMPLVCQIGRLHRALF